MLGPAQLLHSIAPTSGREPCDRQDAPAEEMPPTRHDDARPNSKTPQANCAQIGSRALRLIPQLHIRRRVTVSPRGPNQCVGKAGWNVSSCVNSRHFKRAIALRILN